MDNYTQKLRDDKLLFLTTDEYDLNVYLDAQERIRNTKVEFDIIVNKRIRNYYAYRSLEVLQMKDNLGETVTGNYIFDIISDKSLDYKIEYERDLVRLTYGLDHKARKYFEEHYIIELTSDIISSDFFSVIKVHTYVNREDIRRAKMLTHKW